MAVQDAKHAQDDGPEARHCDGISINGPRKKRAKLATMDLCAVKLFPRRASGIRNCIQVEA